MAVRDPVPPSVPVAGAVTRRPPGAPRTEEGADLAAILGHRFARPDLLHSALVHPSAAMGPAGAMQFQRLEFLGDRVLGLVVADLLLKRFPREPEGWLARRYAALVNRDALGDVAREIGLGAHLRLGKAEEETGGRDAPTILADACEAVIGAFDLGGGLEAARRVIEGAGPTFVLLDVAPVPGARGPRWPGPTGGRSRQLMAALRGKIGP